MKIAFIGPPRAGKSTQAKRVGRALPFYNHSPRLSSGELVRAEIEAETEIGRRIQGHYERGEKVPDEAILSLVLPRLRRSGGFMVDNFPATVSQARAFDEDLEECGAGGLGRVIYLEGPSEDELVGRILSGRRTSRVTGEVYHLQHDPPPRAEEKLDPGPFVRRDDDTEEAVREHLEAHRREAEALKAYYRGRGVLSVVDARRSVEEVTAEVLDALGHPESPRYYETSQRS